LPDDSLGKFTEQSSPGRPQVLVGKEND